MYYFTSNLPLHAFFIHGSVWYADVFRAEQVQRLRDQFWWHTWEKGTWLSALLFPKQTKCCPQDGLKGGSSVPRPLWLHRGGFTRRPSFPLWLPGHHHHPLSLKAKARWPLQVWIWPPDMSEAPFPHVLHVSCCAGGSQTPEARWSFSSVHRWKISEVLFPLIRNGRRESSLFWVLCNQHQLFRTASLWQIIFLCGEIKSNFLI